MPLAGLYNTKQGCCFKGYAPATKVMNEGLSHWLFTSEKEAGSGAWRTCLLACIKVERALAIASMLWAFFVPH